VFYDNFLKLCNSVNKSPSAVVLEIGLQKSTVTRWKNGSMPTDATALKVAEYFEITVDELISDQKEKLAAKSDEPDITFNDFTYALHNESKELTEENKQKLLEMARFFKEQQDKKKNK
jgi:transcriptional regulator with XRE-family HTH domain